MNRFRLWKVFVHECLDFFLDCVQPLILLARWIRQRRK
ncbi:hypothetical protein PTE30175_03510 [Pandoraea terrae]|uniref:Transposase n=1 Tax=Pandoraea terrae TaxID=1537710 RepID=A0A5E4X1I9_9BURK|nr:hypothetical protein PTE30175_03510 [Pandoraea terrae]